VEGKAKRDVGFPGDRMVFEVSAVPSGSGDDVQWSGGGDPAAGTGATFATVYLRGGTYAVTARCNDSSVHFTATICPIDEWMTRAGSFYGPSLDLSRARVKGSRVVFGPAGVGWTCNSVVRFKRPHRAEDLPRESTLIHELGHVWEHQTGRAQLLRGLFEQTGRLLGRDPYDFGGPKRIRRAVRLTEFSMESQAEILMEYWKSQNGYSTDGRGIPFSTTGYVTDLRRLVEGAGIGTRGPTPRRTIAATVDSLVARLVNRILSPFD
jgi:hypothetical protein